MSPRNEAEDLDDLLRHPGWALVTTHARRYWGDELENHLAVAVGDTNDTLALAKMRQIIAAKRAVLALIDWPTERLRQLEAGAASRTPRITESRRGTL